MEKEKTGKELLEEIKLEKEKMIKEGKIKKEKPLPEIKEEEIPYEIPENWVWCRLGEVVEIVTGSTPSKQKKEYYGGDFPFIKPENLNEGRSVKKAKEYLTSLGKDVSRIIPKGSTAVCCIGTIGKSGYVEIEYTTNQQINNLINKEITNNLFTYYYTKTAIFLETMEKVSTSTTIKMVNKSNMSVILFPLPPLSIQKKIVDYLESAMDKIKESRSLFEEALEKIKLQRTSILHKAITGQLTEQLESDGNAKDLLEEIKLEKKKMIKEGKIKKEKPLQEISQDEIPFDIPENWVWCRLGEVVIIQGGKRVPKGEKLTKENTGYPYIRVTDMKKNTILDTDIYYITKEVFEKIKNYRIYKEDIYITVAGTIGSIGLVPEKFDGANLTENANKLVFKQLEKKWLCYYLSSEIIQNSIKELATQGSQPKLAIKRIERLIISLPPLSEQQRIVEIVERNFERLDEIEELIKENQNKLELLEKSILEKAFRGEIIE